MTWHVELLRRNSLLTLLLLCLSLPLHAQERGDSLTTSERHSWVDHTPSEVLLRIGAPMMAFDLLHYGADNAHREMARHYFPGYRTGWDAYAIPIPLMTTWGMHLSGVEGRTRSTLRLATSHAAGALMAVGVTTTTKILTRRTRPDGSDKRSFPSGHTTYAFASAAALDAEYGERYPLLSLSGYALAGTIGLSRVAGHRHWLTDVLTGAGIGIGSVYAGYFLTDLLFKDNIRQSSPLTTWRDQKPWIVSLSYTGILVSSHLSDFKTNRMGFADKLSVRLPLYDRWGLVTQAALLHISSPHEEELDLYSLSGGLSYFYYPTESLLAWEGRACMGYLSEGRISSERYPSSTPAIPHTSSALLAELSGHLHLRLRPQTALSVDVGYMVAPTAHTYDRKETKGWRAPFAGMSLSYLFR